MKGLFKIDDEDFLKQDQMDKLKAEMNNKSVS